MSNITSLYCSPDQGRRLTELVPDLKFNMIWVFVSHEQRWAKFPLFVDMFKNHYKRWYDKQKDMNELVHDSIRHKYASPALTLQELRDMARTIRQNELDGMAYSVKLRTANAPELAAWVIKWLEELK